MPLTDDTQPYADYKMHMFIQKLIQIFKTIHFTSNHAYIEPSIDVVYSNRYQYYDTHLTKNTKSLFKAEWPSKNGSETINKRYFRVTKIQISNLQFKNFN